MGCCLVSKWLCWVVIVLILHSYESKGCTEKEKLALLQIKKHLSSLWLSPKDPNLLPSWIDERAENCCLWERVRCDPSSGHIIDLSLGFLLDSGSGGWFSDCPTKPSFLNMGVFEDLEKLQSLDLSHNCITRLVEDEAMCKLRNLQMLNLTGNGINGEIPNCVGNLSFLTQLDLSDNQFTGTIPSGVCNLRRLQVLDLGDNECNGSLPRCIGNLHSLQHLSLSYNGFSGSISPEKESSGLLRIKQQFSSGLSSPNPPLLPSWLGQGKQNCCLWEGVSCDPSTGRVEELSLAGLADVSPFSTPKHWSLNFTDFEVFEGLRSLDLSSNLIHRLIQDEALCKLRNLQVLNLGSNAIYGRIPRCVRSLNLLQQLDLSDNQFSGRITSGICELKNLQLLYLENNKFNESFPDCIGNLSALEELDLSVNEFSGRIPSKISNLTSLQVLSMSYNSFEGRFSLSSLSNHTNLTVLELSFNKLEIETEDKVWMPSFQLQTLSLGQCSLNKETKTFPRFLAQQESLSYLLLSDNGLVGSFPTYLFHNNSQLNVLNLSNNSLSGSVQFTELQNISFPVTILDLSQNKFSGKLPENIGLVFPPLSDLDLSNNYFEGRIPRSIGELKTVETLDLSQNKFSGEVPEELYSGFDHLWYLSLSSNNLSGEIVPKSMSLTQLQVLFLDKNHFHGEIEDTLLRSSQLVILDVSNNEVSGEIPHWMGRFGMMEVLTLKNNKLHGGIPGTLCNLSTLFYLDLSNNRFSGQIPSCNGTLLKLAYLHLRNNSLDGYIPHELSTSKHLVALDLNGNQLMGGIPLWIGQLSKLVLLQMGNNRLQGEVQSQLCSLQRLNVMDLSNNGISGTIPPCFNNSSFGRELHNTSTDQYHDFLGNSDYLEVITKGRINYYVGDIIYQMSGLDLSLNQLSGHIPLEMGYLKGLHSLNLSHNKLIGLIPKTFSKLGEIESLDLSYNNLSGAIPSELADLNFLEVFNVSYNNLSGRVPTAGQFADFDVYNYEGNPFLCGYVQSGCVGDEPDKSAAFGENTREEEEDEADTKFDWGLFFWSSGASYTTFFLAVVLALYINPEWRTAWFNFVDIHVFWWVHRSYKSVFSC